jgi:hypothetical protein
MDLTDDTAVVGDHTCGLSALNDSPAGTRSRIALGNRERL